MSNIMIVDDSPIIRQSLRAILDKESYYTSNQQLTFNEIIYARVVAKLAFNFLAYRIGQKEILQQSLIR